VEGMPRNATLLEVHNTLFPLYDGTRPFYSNAQIDRMVLSLLDVIDRIMTYPDYVWLEDVVKTKRLRNSEKPLKPVNDKLVYEIDKKLDQFLVDNAVVNSLDVMTSVNPADTQTFMAATRTFMNGLDIQMDNIFAPVANAGGYVIQNDGFDDEMELAIAASLREF
jgi:hypothetical protein